MNTLARAAPLLWAAQPAMATALPSMLPMATASWAAAIPHTRSFATAGAEAEAAAEPAYTIVDVDESGAGEEDGVRVSWFVKRRVKGTTKKLVPLLRQVCALPPYRSPLHVLHVPTLLSADPWLECA